MDSPGDLPGKSFTLYVTNVDGSDALLRISGHLDKNNATLIERLMAEADNELKAGKGLMPPGMMPPPGVLIAARYKDSNFYRARVQASRDGYLSVLFVDYGYQDVIPASAARTLDFAPKLALMPALAEEYILAHVWQPAGRWEPSVVKHLTNMLCYNDQVVVVEAKAATHSIVSVQITGGNLSSYLVTNRLGMFVSVQGQADCLNQIHLDPQVACSAPVVGLDSGHSEHIVPFAPNRMFPSNPASTMRMHSTTTGSFNGAQASMPQISNPFSASQRLQAIRSAPRNMTNLKPLARQPFVSSGSPQQIPAHRTDITSPAPLAAAAAADPASPKKNLAYKVRFLQPNSEHKVYVSIAREGPEVFAVQLTSEARRLQIMMNELNRVPHRNLPSPPAPGTVCLGRQSSDRTICRALSMGVCGSKAKLYFVDFGDTELVSFYDVFVIPEQFMQEPMYCFQFRLARSHQLKAGPELNEAFQNLVEHKNGTLKVVQAEEAPLIQFAELYVNQKNVTDSLLEQSPPELQYLDVLPVGATHHVLLSYVDSCLKFFVQLSDNIDTLNKVMEAVEAHCKATPPLESVVAGAPCCALFPDDGVWYRAQVLEARGNRALVCYVDYGNEQEVALSDLRSITAPLLELPAQTLKCALKGFEDEVQPLRTNQLEMLALERVLRAHVLAHVGDGDVMLVTLTAEHKKLDIASQMLEILPLPKAARPATPEAHAQGSALSPDSSEPDRNRFRSDRHFREERRPRNAEWAPRGGSFRAAGDRQSGKPWERNQETGSSANDWGVSNRAGEARSGPNRRKPKTDQPDTKLSKSRWKPKGDNPKRFNQGSDTSDTSSHQSDGSQRTQHSSVQQRLRRDDFKKPDDSWGDGNDSRPKRSNWGEKKEKKDWDMNDDRCDDNPSKDSWGDKRNQSDKSSWGERKDRGDNDSWGEKRDRGDKSSWGERKDRRENDNWGEKKDRGEKSTWGENRDREDKGSRGEQRDRGEKSSWGDRKERAGNDNWGDKKENFTKRTYQDRGERKESTNFTPRDRTERTFDPNRSFGSNKSDTGGRFKPAPVVKELPRPVPLDTQFLSLQIESGSQQEVAVAWFISPESFYAQITSEQSAFTEMMNSIPEIYKGVRPFSGNIEVGSSILARYPDDRVLYRATVLGVQPFGKYIVQYVDFGNKYVVESKDVWQLDEQLMALPRMAVHCSLVGVKAPDGEWKKGKEIDLCFNAPRYQCIFQECADEIYRVSLWNNGQSVAELLAEKNLAVLAEQTSITLKDEPIDLSIVTGQQMLCRVTHIDSIDKFHIQLDLEKAALVESTIANLDPALLQPLPAESVEEGMHCTLAHEGRVHRAILENVSDKGAVKALLPDYGYSVTVGADQLTILPPELSVYYYQSLVCSFHNYTATSRRLLTDEELKQRLTGNKFIIYINYVDGTGLVSTLYDLKGAKVAAFEPDEGAYDNVSALCERPVYNYNFGTAFVSHAESLALVYLQKASDGDRIALLLDHLFKFYEEGTPEEPESFEASSLCAAKSSDGNWYRATITNSLDEEFKVNFVDYGNDEIVPKASIKKLDPKFYEPYSLALVISLGLIPLQDDAVAKLLELVGEQEVLVTLTIGDEGWLANLHLNGEDLAIKLVENKIATPQISHLDEPKAEAVAVQEPLSLPAGTVQVYIAHVDTPGQFWLQMADQIERIEEIQAELQEKGISYPELETKEIGTLCVAKYSVDEMWYRAEVLDSDADITTVRFIDYGNTDVLDNVPDVLKEIPDNLKEDRHAVKASVNAVPTGTGQWSEAASDFFTELVGDMSVPLDAVIVLKDVTTYVDLFVNGENLTNKLVLEHHATKSEETECGDLATCFASHVNSPSEFWIQLENSTSELQEVEIAMSDSENFPELTDREEGTICAAKYPEDGCWYRAQIIVEGSEGIEVLFMDYGNASIANELRSLPEELKVKPALSRKCALQKPREVKSWSRKSELKFNEMAAEGATIFSVQFIASGDISIVELYLDGKSVTEELASLCEVPPASERPAPLGQDILAAGTVCHTNSIQDFYVTLDESSDNLDKIAERLTQAETFDDATDVKVGSSVVAFWTEDEQWYRAKIIEFCDVGAHVQFLDYGNKAKCEKFKQVPAEFAGVEPLATHCTLVGCSLDVATDENVNEQFQALVTDPDALVQIEFLDTTNEPTVVRLLLKGEDVSNLIKNRSHVPREDNNVSKVESDLNKSTESDNQTTGADELIPKQDLSLLESDSTDETEVETSKDLLKQNILAETNRLDDMPKNIEDEKESEVSDTRENDIKEVEPFNTIEKEINNEVTSMMTGNEAGEKNYASPLNTSLHSDTDLETSKFDDENVDTSAEKEIDLESSQHDDSAEGNITVIETQSSEEQLVNFPKEKSERGNESFLNFDEAFSTPPDSPKKSSSSGSPDNRDKYQECEQTPSKQVDSQSLKAVAEKAEELDATEFESNTTEIESNTTEIESNTTEIESNTTEIESNTTEIESNTTEIELNTTEIKSNTFEIESNTTEIKFAIPEHEKSFESVSEEKAALDISAEKPLVEAPQLRPTDEAAIVSLAETEQVTVPKTNA